MVLDVREPDEYEQGALPGAIHIPRGHLESQVEGKITDHDAHIVVYCAGGTRSAFAADTLAQLGYTDVVSVVGGFNKWKDEGRAWQAPVSLTAEQRNRYQRHLLLPEVDVAGQAKLLESKVLCSAPAGLGLAGRACTSPPPGWAPSASSTWTSSTSPTCSARSCTTWTGWGSAKVDSAKKTLTALNPDVNVVTYDVRLGADNVLDIFDRLRRDRGRHRQLPDPLPGQRRLAEAGHPGGARLDLPFRGPGQRVPAAPGPCYRCQVPEPPPAELAPCCAEAGVLGVLPGIIGSIQAMETIKLLLGIGEPLVGRLLAYDALEESFRTFKVNRDPECAACITSPKSSS